MHRATWIRAALVSKPIIRLEWTFGVFFGSVFGQLVRVPRRFRLSKTGRYTGLVLTAAMFAFSTWMYVTSGDWVAAVFAAGSLGYGIFFLTASRNTGP